MLSPSFSTSLLQKCSQLFLYTPSGNVYIQPLLWLLEDSVSYEGIIEWQKLISLSFWFPESEFPNLSAYVDWQKGERGWFCMSSWKAHVRSSICMSGMHVLTCCSCKWGYAHVCTHCFHSCKHLTAQKLGALVLSDITQLHYPI